MSFKIRTLQRAVVIVLLSLGAIIFVVPVFWTAATSFKTPKEIMTVPPTLLPNSFSYMGNYHEVFERANSAAFFSILLYWGSQRYA